MHVKLQSPSLTILLLVWFIVSNASCESVANLRRKLQRISNKRIIFLVETHFKINEAPRTTLVAPDEKPYIIVTDSSSYAARYDMIAASQ
ncbi:unnamed protein product [Rotaria sp. Silwood1]|nr:unnamed protein product [Rotaria sp. Silwood1]